MHPVRFARVTQPGTPPDLTSRSSHVLGLTRWVGGAVSTAFQPTRLVAGFVIALAIWLPGLAWDTFLGAHMDAPGLLGEPYDDAEQAAVQATLRRLAADYAPDVVYESARVPAAELAAVLEERTLQAPDQGSRDQLAVAAAHAASLAPLGSFEALSRAEATAGGMVVDGLLGAAPADMAQGVRLCLWDIPHTLWARDPVFCVVFGLWSGLVAAVGLGALGRMEAVQASGRGVIKAGEGFRFAADRWADLVLAWLAPLGIAAVLGVVCAAWGLLFRIPGGGWVASVLYVVPLALGAVAGLSVLIWALGAPLAPAAVACDALDSLDADQRGAIYFIARPGAWLAYAVTVIGVSAFGLVVVRVVAWLATSWAAVPVSLGAAGRAQVDVLRVTPGGTLPTWSGPGVAVGWWLGLVGVIVAGAFVSLLAGLLTRMYLALREGCDGQPRTEVWPYEVLADVSDAVTPGSPINPSRP